MKRLTDPNEDGDSPLAMGVALCIFVFFIVAMLVYAQSQTPVY